MNKSMWKILWASLAIATLGACDGGNGPDPPPPPTPSAAITVTGNGDIAVHPSLDFQFGAAIEFPIRIQETGGGTAVWNYFRVSYFRGAAEVERNEVGADAIQRDGFRNIGARMTMEPDVITRVNVTDWDEVEIKLGFADQKDGREFEHSLTLDAFAGVVLDFVPAVLPDDRTVTIVGN